MKSDQRNIAQQSGELLSDDQKFQKLLTCVFAHGHAVSMVLSAEQKGYLKGS